MFFQDLIKRDFAAYRLIVTSIMQQKTRVRHPFAVPAKRAV